ncbi:hypothetical protein PS903_01030 [Pseudomonas fluorescens]|nr:hypothetical protein PS903_01030 [Pseudomonas fluorescens]
MFNTALNSRRLISGRIPGVANAMSMIEGHHRFLVKNTGDTTDATVQHYVQNTQGVLANNRHFIAHSQMEYQPNGDGTTEGQSLHIIGYAYAYLATQKPEYLEAARWHWDAYVQYFYAGQPIPEAPSRWIANWIVNSKEPVLANWPIDPVSPTHSGFKGIPFTFTNGFTLIPHGAPHWGEYLDKATFAFDGVLAWEAINASVQGLKADGSVDWDNAGAQYDVDWIIAHTGQKINWDGDVLSEGHPVEVRGSVQLKSTTLNGSHKLNYATRQPVEHGGYLIPRNAVQHNRPLHVPLLGSVNQMGNAADGEEWFADACYLMWKITGETPYKKALDSCLFTTHEYTQIDSVDKFFRQSVEATTPFTDGISYDFVYPDTAQVTYGRDTGGFITANCSEAGTVSLEQQSVWFRITKDSLVRTSYGGVDSANGPLAAKVEVTISQDKSEGSGIQYTCALPKSASNAVVAHDIPLSQFTRMTKDNGSEYILADLRAVLSSDDIVSVENYEPAIFEGRAGTVVKSFFPNDEGWYAIGHYLLASEKAPMHSITYRADGYFNLRFADDNGWRWWWMLPPTEGAFVTLQIRPEDATLSGYQPGAAGRPEPDSPVYSEIEEFSILMDSSDTNLTFEYYCVNDLPPTFAEDDGYTLKYRLTVSGGNPFLALLGDCTVTGYRDDSLAYTPGLIPFSNIYEEGSAQIGAWHGMPYPGYQYPFIYCLEPVKYSRHLGNMIDFLYDSQQWYYTRFGQLGPGASAYIWNRWDNYKYGTPDTFTMYHWGDGTAWSGYQPRAFQAACRAWQELVEQGQPVPAKLQAYAENWIGWLADFQSQHNGVLPTDFPMASVPQPVPDDFTGHVTGLWLAGACMAAMAGCQHPKLDQLIEACVTELQNNYVVTPVPAQPMNGCWSPAVRLGTDNGMFFGFWAGEIMRGLSMYILLKELGPGASIFSRQPLV